MSDYSGKGQQISEIPYQKASEIPCQKKRFRNKKKEEKKVGESQGINIKIKNIKLKLNYDL